MSNFPTTGMILAAGLGSRLRPLTETMPKPLVRVAGKALVDHAIDFYTAAGIRRIVVNSSYLAEMLEAHVKQRHDVELLLSREDAPLETGGGVRKALPLLGDQPFFVMNSDAICVNRRIHALQRLWDTWNSTAECDALLLAQPIMRAVGYEGAGDFFIGAKGTIRRRTHEVHAPFVFTGVQLLHPRLFEGTPEGPFSMNLLYNRFMQQDGTLAHAKAVIHQGDWLHVGDTTGLKQAEAWFAQ